MKNLLKLPITLMSLIVLVSCSASSDDSPVIIPGPSQGIPPVAPPDDDTGEEDSSSNIYFGFLNGEGVSETYMEMPIDSSVTNLFVGRWVIKNFRYEMSDWNESYDYKDYGHKDCGQSFLQFNNDGVVFENIFFKENGTCSLTVEIANWELIAENRLKIGDNIIYIDELTQTEMVLRFDADDVGWGPLLLFYHYERKRSPD